MPHATSARVGVIAAIGILASASLGACALLVGDPHGQLPADASVSGGERSDGDVLGDAVGTSEGGPAQDGGGALDGGIGSDGAPSLDGPVVCDAAFDSDPTNCGWCGHDCLGVSCTGGSCAAQIVFTANAASMAIEGTVLYCNDGPSIDAYDLSTGYTQTIAAAQNAPGKIVVHSPYVFWTTADGMIHRVLEDGGAPSVVAQRSVNCLAANSSKLYWWETASGKAYSVPVDSDGGAAPVVEYTGIPGTGGCVSADDSTLAVLANYVLVEHDLDSGLATTATLPDMAYTQFVRLAGAYAVVLTTSSDDAGTTGHVNLVTNGTNKIQEVATFPWSAVLATVADDAGIYWSPQGEWRIDGCSDLLCTGGVRHFTPPLTNFTLTGVALDPTYVYVSKGGTSTILKFAR